jgi:hypothetical protein
VLALNFVRRQRDDATRYVESLSALGEAGSTAGGGYFRQRAALAIGVAARSEPLTTLRLAYGSVGGGGGAARERFVVGGTSGPLMDPELDARRVEAPAYPLGSTVGSSFAAYRVGVPVAPLELYYAGASTDAFQHPLRSYGAEWRQRASAIPALGMPDVALVAGIARAVDEPVKGTWRFYMTIAIQP